MIDASTFAIQHHAFWNATAPTCEHFIRKINLNLYERFDRPLPRGNETRSSLVAETGFYLFKAVVEQHADAGGTSQSKLIEAAKESAKRQLQVRAEASLDLSDPLSNQEISEAKEISTRLQRFFIPRKGKIQVSPLFAGCGYVDMSEGDVISGRSYFEIKTVERNFRSADLRQTLVYCALDRLSGKFNLEELGILNPRRGVFFCAGIDDVCFEISGLDSSEFFALVVNAVSSGELSR